MKTTVLLIVAAAVGTLALWGCGSTSPSRSAAAPGSTAQRASIVLAPASGSLVSGKLNATPANDGVRLTGEIGGLKPDSSHALHIHEHGDCSSVDASSAGGHFNPGQQPHGRAGADPHHAGDMDNIVADAYGVAHVDVRARGVTLGGGASNDVAGRAVVVHAGPDDYRSQPAGNAGARVACGVIRVLR